MDEKSVSSENDVVKHLSDAWIANGWEKATAQNVANKEINKNVVVGPGKVLIYDTPLRGQLTVNTAFYVACYWEPLVGRC